MLHVWENHVHAGLFSALAFLESVFVEDRVDFKPTFASLDCHLFELQNVYVGKCFHELDLSNSRDWELDASCQ